MKMTSLEKNHKIKDSFLILFFVSTRLGFSQLKTDYLNFFWTCLQASNETLFAKSGINQIIFKIKQLLFNQINANFFKLVLKN